MNSICKGGGHIRFTKDLTVEKKNRERKRKEKKGKEIKGNE